MNANKLIRFLVFSFFVESVGMPLFASDVPCGFDKGDCTLAGIIKHAKENTVASVIPASARVPDIRLLEFSEVITDAYQYPIKPGTKEWKLIVGHDERVKACQIPESVLKTMSTAGLVETVLTYPHYGDMRAYDTLQKGFGYMSSRFNGFQELFTRKDSGTVLLERYKAMDPAVFRKGFASAERGRSIWDFENVEILLVQNAIIAGLTEVQHQDLRREALLKYQEKKQYTESYGKNSLMLTASLAGEVSQHDPLRYYQTSVNTPRGSSVSAFQMVPMDELTPQEEQNIYAWLSYNYPNPSQLTRATRMYNCHSYAWYSQSESNAIRINGPYQSTYWTDGSYVLWPSGTAYQGMKLSYYNDDHSAIFYSGQNPSYSPGSSYCLSKWGSMPLMYHVCSDCPYNSMGIAIYTSTRI